ncbi:hypothetical protein P12x_002572 [Tundrisphaera lichenicola]|uniref:hypothetical protein n=1 Tax=Tundrisphaera lichenicola TaxID=2029860 RepID=UPI003EB6FCDC
MAHAKRISTQGVASVRLGAFLLGCSAFVASTSLGQEIDRDPINYSVAAPRNAVSRLQELLDRGQGTLEYEPEHGYLRSLLRALDVPESSQVLVFSKTSLQRDRISPRTPRAIYFNDEVMIGSCLRGRVLEISAADEVLGTAFYTLDQSEETKPVPQRQTESCLICHSSSANQGFPGHVVRSLFVDRKGYPLLSSGTFRTDHKSPIAERWGGWYVTGTSGAQIHLGNMTIPGSRRPEVVDNSGGVNVVDLKDRFATSSYLTSHSDIVALMVLEHQAGMLNRLARAGMETRMALHYEREMNKALGRPDDAESPTTRSRIRSVGDAVVRYMLLGGEAPLTERIEGTSSFAADFSGRGPRDSKGRSLRDLDLNGRLFRYPCSYLIYTRSFDSLPVEVRDYVYRRLWEHLGESETGEEDRKSETGQEDPRLSAEDRRAIIEILRETKPGLPDYWKASSP